MQGTCGSVTPPLDSITRSVKAAKPRALVRTERVPASAVQKALPTSEQSSSALRTLTSTASSGTALHAVKGHVSTSTVGCALMGRRLTAPPGARTTVRRVPVCVSTCGLGFGVQGAGVQGLGSIVWGSRFRFWSLVTRIRIWN